MRSYIETKLAVDSPIVLVGGGGNVEEGILNSSKISKLILGQKNVKERKVESKQLRNLNMTDDCCPRRSRPGTLSSARSRWVGKWSGWYLPRSAGLDPWFVRYVARFMIHCATRHFSSASHQLTTVSLWTYSKHFLLFANILLPYLGVLSSPYSTQHGDNRRDASLCTSPPPRSWPGLCLLHIIFPQLES